MRTVVWQQDDNVVKSSGQHIVLEVCEQRPPPDLIACEHALQQCCIQQTEDPSPQDLQQKARFNSERHPLLSTHLIGLAFQERLVLSIRHAINMDLCTIDTGSSATLKMWLQQTQR
jgi:hypothetical protein